MPEPAYVVESTDVGDVRVYTCDSPDALHGAWRAVKIDSATALLIRTFPQERPFPLPVSVYVDGDYVFSALSREIALKQIGPLADAHRRRAERARAAAGAQLAEVERA